MIGIRSLASSALVGLIAFVSPASIGAGPSPAAPEGSKEARKELQLAAKLLSSKNGVEQGIEKLRAIIAKYPLDEAAEKAAGLLTEFGVGDEVRVRLVDRTTFRKSLGVEDRAMLEKVEKLLEDLRESYGPVPKVFTQHTLELAYYDSQERFRSAGGEITSSGRFTSEKKDFATKSIAGKIETYPPIQARSIQDRETALRGSLIHECTHYLNAIHLAGALPSVFDEGLATWFTSRLNTESYQYFRITDRERLESDCRNTLNLIAKYPDFVKFLSADRGFGRGDATVERWYALCYSVVDFFEGGEIGGKKASRKQLVEALRLAVDEAVAAAKGRSPKALPPQALLERIVKEFYGADLPAFHAALVARIVKDYKQR